MINFNYILIASAILNSILLMFVVGVVPFFLYFSLIVNCGLIWYIQKILTNSNNLREDVYKIFSEIESYSDHLDQIHEMETFYGDQNLQSLISHTRTLINNIIDVQEKYYDNLEVIEDEESEEDQTP